MEDAILALDRIEGEIPRAIEDDIDFLRANIYLAEARPEESLEVLEKLQDSESYGAFSAYNLGIAYLQAGRRTEALEQLERAGLISTDDAADMFAKTCKSGRRTAGCVSSSSFDGIHILGRHNSVEKAT